VTRHDVILRYVWRPVTWPRDQSAVSRQTASVAVNDGDRDVKRRGLIGWRRSVAVFSAALPGLCLVTCVIDVAAAALIRGVSYYHLSRIKPFGDRDVTRMPP